MYALKQRKTDFCKPIPMDPVAICLLYLLLRSHTNCYQNTMTGLPRQLVQTAEHMGMDPCQIPATPRMLGIRLEMLEPDLEETLGARLTICHVNDVPRSVQIIF
ncbi:MAG: hypothetical protein SOW08_08300 [Lachnospiraceae bacterium]|nr:hypothetical protein [Lachnospiraceae bacterium]